MRNYLLSQGLLALLLLSCVVGIGWCCYNIGVYDGYVDGKEECVEFNSKIVELW